MLAKGHLERQNLIAVAGGGGATGQSANANGGAGGSSTSGGNGSTATDMTRCFGKSGAGGFSPVPVDGACILTLPIMYTTFYPSSNILLSFVPDPEIPN